MLELAWAAGFFDGEGSAFQMRGKKPGQVYLALQVSQKDKRPLERFSKALGIGRVRGPYKSHNGQSFWAVSGKKAQVVIEQLWPYLSEPKREQITRVEELNKLSKYS